jgi:transmembrane protein EpsG
MTILWINLVIVYVFSALSRLLAVPDANNPLVVKPNKLMVLVVISSLVLISGLRRNIGDTFFYAHMYRINDYTWEYVTSKKDMGFGFLQMFLQQITDDPQLLIFLCALITNVLIVLVLYKYTKLFELSMFVYITSGMFLVSMNGMRQYLAAAIIFAGTKYIIEGNWKKYFLIVLLASSIHGSAFVLIPMYYVVRRKAWTATSFLIIVCAILAALAYGQISQFIFAAIESTSYAEYKDFGEGGANIIRVVFYAIPTILAYLGRERLRELFPQSDCFVNMSVLGLVFMVISTQNWIFARYSIYFGLYNLVLISWLVHTFVRQERKLVYYSIIVLYVIYCFYEQAVSLNVIYRSDYI